MDILREACVGNFVEAKRAYELGAHRIELCDNLEEGGTTPSYGTVKLCKETLDIPINVIIRPRGGDFVYTEDEISIMEQDIEICKELKVDGIVIGALTKDNNIDIKTIKRLLKKAEDLSITFHMAFDEIEDKKTGLDRLIELGIDRVLTKGGQGKAIDNQSQLKELVDYAGDRIIILAGGGVTQCNYKELVRNTGVKEVHGRKIVDN
ncbi:copper homeostasis protein CutC [Clostridium sp. Cult1]|uniref:copper homeostasis protein CutC n=1 Tax=Clostridium sp. Cult1 TaxID=2079002 RepID=UPI001F1D23C5|nr:copper homeostasis protein CutC [Clostridium sp. Cult1]MCF6464014.1 copper homeostasis protein CutC [Clostridium sp. Cult1]